MKKIIVLFAIIFAIAPTLAAAVCTGTSQFNYTCNNALAANSEISVVGNKASISGNNYKIGVNGKTYTPGTVTINNGIINGGGWNALQPNAGNVVTYSNTTANGKPVLHSCNQTGCQ